MARTYLIYVRVGYVFESLFSEGTISPISMIFGTFYKYVISFLVALALACRYNFFEISAYMFDIWNLIAVLKKAIVLRS